MDGWIITSAITVAGILAQLVTQTLVARGTWKRQRQFELYKAGKSVDLIPPPSPAWMFLKQHWITIASLLLQATVLTKEIFSDGPVTRGSVFKISSSLALVVLILTTEALTAAIRKILEITKLLSECDKDLVDISRDLTTSVLALSKTQTVNKPPA